VGYRLRFSEPRGTLTARRVRHGVNLAAGPRPGIKACLSPAAFPTALSIPIPIFAFLHRPPSCFRRRRAPLTPCRPLIPHRTIRLGQLGKYLSATTGSHSLDASAALSHRPSDRASAHGNVADEAPDVPTGRRRPSHAKTLDTRPLLPSSKPRQPTYHTSSRLHRNQQGRISTLTSCVITASLLPRPFTDLYHGWFRLRDWYRLCCGWANGENAAHSARAPLKRWLSSSRERAQTRH
jgi:hypothetical protein